jgi:hypothetical protein
MKDKVIFVDHSILSTFSTCHEKARLSYVEHIRPIETGPPLVFGSAFHAAIAAYYSEIAYGRRAGAADAARTAFLKEVRESGPDSLPLSADSEEKRSVERGLYLIDAYIEKWSPLDTTWEDILRPDTAEPYIEIGFAIYFMDWHGVPVVYAGKMDRLRRNRVDGNIYVWETKTTGSSVSYYVQQTRPNHQFTGYKWAARELLGMNVAGIILDVIHISDRKVGGKFPNGIDIEKDFGRIETRRSQTDLDEFLCDIKMKTEQFLTQQETPGRWDRNAPAACFMYGGCHYRDICNSNLNPSIIASKYRVERWAPWEMTVPELTKLPVLTSH